MPRDRKTAISGSLLHCFLNSEFSSVDFSFSSMISLRFRKEIARKSPAFQAKKIRRMPSRLWLSWFLSGPGSQTGALAKKTPIRPKGPYKIRGQFLSAPSPRNDMQLEAAIGLCSELEEGKRRPIPTLAALKLEEEKRPPPPRQELAAGLY